MVFACHETNSTSFPIICLPEKETGNFQMVFANDISTG